MKTGNIFVAIKGNTGNGEQYIASAIAAGAKVIVAEAGYSPTPEVSSLAIQHNCTITTVLNVRLHLSELAAIYYPKQPENILAVTGTDGKTSVADFCRQIWFFLNIPAASIGTLGLKLEIPDGVQSAAESLRNANTHDSTSPDPVTLHHTLQLLAENNIQNVALEASSHGLDQCRIHSVRLAAAGFTYLGRDHLDYHKTMEHYKASKLKLFSEVLTTGGVAVINADDENSADFASAAQKRGIKTVLYGKNSAAEIKIIGLEFLPHGLSAHVEAFGERYSFTLNMAGDFQLWNFLCAAGMVASTGADMRAIFSIAEKIKSATGRLDLVAKTADNAAVYVDYAHTPNALEKSLLALRRHSSGKLVVIFGCGGDRDSGKRPLMGEVASRIADIVIVTDDNPRGENPAEIRRQIINAAPDALEVGDRRQAIRKGLAMLNTGGVMLVAGKGHESVQIYGSGSDEVRHPFNDAEVIMEELATYS